MPDHNLTLLKRVDFHDAGPEGLAVLLLTQPSQKHGKGLRFGFLLNAEGGKSLLRGLASALEQKYPGQVVTE